MELHRKGVIVITERMRLSECSRCHDAADELDRLRKAGNRLFMHLDSFYGTGSPCPDWIQRDLTAWKEVYNG